MQIPSKEVLLLLKHSCILCNMYLFISVTHTKTYPLSSLFLYLKYYVYFDMFGTFVNRFSMIGRLIKTGDDEFAYH